MATRHYSVPHFFRQVPNALLRRYFAGHDLFGDVDFERMPEAKPDALLGAWNAISDAKRMAIETQLREVFDLACVNGIHAIRDAARGQLGAASEQYTAFLDSLAALKSHYERAMTTFLDHHECWRQAVQFCHADSLSYWRKRRGLPSVAAATDKANLAALEDEIGRWFHKEELRGRNCRVEFRRRDERDYFFAFPQDFANEVIEWSDGDLAPRPHNPAFEVVFVWSQSEGSLDLNYRGTPKAKDALQAAFARNILALEKLPPAPKDGRIYDLSALKRREFPFVYAASSGIKSVALRAVRLSSAVRKGDRMKLEADTSRNPLALYDVIEQAGKAFALAQWNVTQAEFVARIAATEERPERNESFTVSFPNSCSLSHDGIDATLRAMLVASGIEPQ